MSDEVKDPIEAEFVEQAETLPAVIESAKIDKRKKKVQHIELEATEHYVKKFKKKDRDLNVETLLDQTDAMLLLCKETALKKLEEAAAGDGDALLAYKDLIQAAFVLVQEREKLMKFFKIEMPESAKPYKAQEMSQDEWEKTFKPQVKQLEQQKKEDIFLGPANSSKVVN